MLADQGGRRADRLGVGARDKHDGYRLMVRRMPDGVRIKTRNGYDWTDRFPLIVAAAERLRASSFVLDGEGVILRRDGVADFDRLHSEVQLLGFDAIGARRA
jgi:bifunctional non-homologous end joining protein LigD